MSKVCKNCKAEEVFKIEICQDCYNHSVILTKEDGTEYSWYTPQPHQRPYHESNAPNLLALGTRGTGKSTQMRKDAIIRCMMFPNYKVLILRRKIPDLRKSHLQFINGEMQALGTSVGYFRETTFDVKFTNNSFIQFSHCEKLKDVENYLSSAWDLIIFDELSTFPLEMFLMISAAARSPTDAPYVALVRCGSNTLGIGAAWMKQWFIDHDVNLAEYPDYLPDDFEMQYSTLDDNKYVNRAEYERRLRNLPDHVKRAWLNGEFIIEGAYFTDFKKNKHCINAMPTLKDMPVQRVSWINVYRSIDWGYFPDPAVCHWHVVMPSKLKITFMEKTWTRTLAADVANEIKLASSGMHIVESYCDPTMFIKTGNSPYSIAEIFEQNGVPLTASQNDRVLFGYSLHEMLNTIVEDKPSWQILEYACPELVRTLPLLLMDPNDPSKVADGPDHWAISCAYFAMGKAPVSRDPVSEPQKRWMLPKRKHRNLGA